MAVSAWSPAASRPNRIPDFENVVVPRASAYVVEAHPQLPVTEAVVTGIHARQPTARILVLAERFADQTAFALLRLGIKGLLTYAETARSLMAASPDRDDRRPLGGPRPAVAVRRLGPLHRSRCASTPPASRA